MQIHRQKRIHQQPFPRLIALHSQYHQFRKGILPNYLNSFRFARDNLSLQVLHSCWMTFITKHPSAQLRLRATVSTFCLSNQCVRRDSSRIEQLLKHRRLYLHSSVVRYLSLIRKRFCVICMFIAINYTILLSVYVNISDAEFVRVWW